MENKIYFNFSFLALKLLGSGLYSNPWSAISELIANGFDANASKVCIHINAVDKKHSTIEIFDNGQGMTYQELVDKYVFVGRNKRLDADIDDKSAIMGRKGIGKLATLYLSNHVQIISRTIQETSSWSLDISNMNEDDKPALVQIPNDEIPIYSKKEWMKNETGVFIRLTDVNLQGLGEKTLAGLKNRLSDFYLLDNSNRIIAFSFIENEGEKVVFEKVEKNIAYKNFYVLFNNSNTIFPDYENHRIKIQNKYPEILSSYPIQILDVNQFTTKGISSFTTADQTEIDKEYELTGWIGLHTSINQTNARANDPTFLKNRITSPNRLRLYIRGKLAIENFLDYLKSSQAFSNYLEGEISFDILDDDDLPDITTANRQQISVKDSRVQLLINLLNPIVTKLIQTRIALAKRVSDDVELIDQKRIEEISIRHEVEIKKISEEREAALLAKKQASAELEARNQQVLLLSKGLRKDAVRLADALHTIHKITNTIDKKINRLLEPYKHDKAMLQKFYKDVSAIRLLNNKSHLMTKYAFNGNYNLKSKLITEHIGAFISQYVKVIAESKVKTKVIYDAGSNYSFCFDSTMIGIIIDNVLSNSEKFEAKEMTINVSIVNNKAIIEFADNGLGYDHELFPNPNVFFEFGVKNPNVPGYGIGLHSIHEMVKTNGGSCYIDSNYEGGFKLVIEIINKEDE